MKKGMLFSLTALFFSLILTGCYAFSHSETDVEMTGPKEAIDRLTDMLGDKMEGKMVIETGEEEINGATCQTFAIGTNTPEKFTAEEHFAVSPKGAIYYINIIEGADWIPYVPES